MDERSYTHVARILNAYGVWTSWCSVFLTEAGFKLIGMPHLERSLRSCGWTGQSLTLHTDIDIGAGFGYGNILIDESTLGGHADRWLKAAQNHVTEHHMSYVNEGKRTLCTPTPKTPRITL